MRVWVYPEKAYEELGAKRWEVEWQTVKPSALKRVQLAEAKGEYDEIDIDSDIVYHRRVFPERAKGLAIAYGKRVVSAETTAFGSATVTPQVVDWYVEEDRVAEWANAGDPIYVP